MHKGLLQLVDVVAEYSEDAIRKIHALNDKMKICKQNHHITTDSIHNYSRPHPYFTSRASFLFRFFF